MGFKAYRQLEQSDCGITCIRMIARSYGQRIPLKYLRSIAETGKQGISVKELTDGFKAIGMESAAVRLSSEEIMRMPCPAILYWQQRHFVVIYKIDPKHRIYYIADPADGKLKFTEEEFLGHWLNGADKGIAVLAEPGEGFGSTTYPRDGVLKGLCSLAKSELGRHRRSLALILLLSLVCMAADLLVPLMLQSTVDKGIAQKDIGLVWMLILGQLAVFLGNAASSNLLQYLMIKLGLSVNLDMTRRYLEKLIRFPLSFFDRKSSSDLIQKIDDQARIKDFLLQLPQSVFFMLLNLIVFSGLLIWYNPWLFLFFLAFTVGEIGWTLIFLGPRKGIDYAYFIQAAENRNQVYELVNGMAEIKTNNAQGSRLEKWERTQRLINRLSMKSSLMSMGMGGGQSVISRIKEISITGICATLVIDGSLTLGMMMTVGYIVGRLSGPFQNLIATISRIQDASISYERLDEVLGDGAESQGDTAYSRPEIELLDVGFRYPGASSPFVIDGLTLKVERGKTTAIVGESGCGKTTLIKLMLGFYIPQKGSLRLSDTDVAELDRDSWMSHCGVVMQSGYIFSDSIKANIAIGAEKTDEIRLRTAIETVGLDSFIKNLPMGLDTRIGPTGLELSGGQKQRLLIARAIYKQPEILFLDEATSSLDASNERVITERILEMQRGKTLIIAAHRLSTVKNADCILFMKDGQIMERGTHSELVELGGEYFRLVSDQLALSV